MLKVSFLGHYQNYEKTLVPSTLRKIQTYEVTDPWKCDILIYGPFLAKNKFEKFKFKLARKNAIKVFHSSENTRIQNYKAHFFITSDLGMEHKNHIRIPHWYNIIDWSHENIKNGLDNNRFGRLISIDELMKKRPFVNGCERQKKACAVFAHLGEPRRSLLERLKGQLIVDGYGPAFNKRQKDHNSGNFPKKDILKKYLFNFCPENSMHPGYYTEKPVEAWAAGCIPIYWADPMFTVDFNKNSIINMYDYYTKDLKHALKNEDYLRMVYEEPLIKTPPNIKNLEIFLKNILSEV